MTVQLVPAARTVVAVQVPPLIMEKVPPAVPTFAIVGAELKVIEPVPTLLTVTRPVLVAVPLGPPVVNAGVGPVNDTGIDAVTLNSEVHGGPMGLVPAGVVMSTQWPPSAELAGTVNVAVAVVAFTTTTLVMTGPFEPGWNMVAGAAKFAPVTVTGKLVPRAPDTGENEVIVGPGGAVTVNVTALLVPPGVTTVTFLAPAVPAITQFAVTVVAVGVPVIVQVLPPDTFTAVAPVRLVPVRVTGTVVPLTPDTGEIEVSVGAGGATPLPVASTAPTSTQACPSVLGLQFRPLVAPTESGLWLPKKSVVGRVIAGNPLPAGTTIVHWLAPWLEHGM